MAMRIFEDSKVLHAIWYFVQSLELHNFSDASTFGYGQCTYVRSVDGNGQVSCCLVMAKSRVTPLNAVSIPSLELTTALVSIRVTNFLKQQNLFPGAVEYFGQIVKLS